VARLKDELLWPAGVCNVFFGVSDAVRQFANVALSIHATYSYTSFSIETEAHDRRLDAWASVDLSTAA
jgi:hypothetical protein